VIIQCLSFGTCWWLRSAKDEHTSAIILAKSAFMNTTGFGKKEWKHRSPGFIRINAGRIVIASPDELLQQKFMTAGLTSYFSKNNIRSSRLLLESRVAPETPTDAYLVTVRSDRDGHINFQSDWRSKGVRVVSSSSRKNQMDQETALLMPVASHIQTSLGRMEVVCRKNLYLLALVNQ
jgi:hypothetical protein